MASPIMAPFRLLDLAAELRNNIYEQALTHDRESGRVATVALLATCKQVYFEAKGIFHALSTFAIKIQPGDDLTGDTDYLHPSLTISGDMTCSVIERQTALLNLHPLLPPQIMHVAEVRINLSVFDFDDEKLPFYCEDLASRFFYALTCRLNSDNSRQTLRIIISGSPAVLKHEGFVVEPLQSLQLLAPSKSLKVTGLQEEVMENLQTRLGKRPTSASDFFDPVVFYKSRGETIKQHLRKCQEEIGLGRCERLPLCDLTNTVHLSLYVSLVGERAFMSMREIHHMHLNAILVESLATLMGYDSEKTVNDDEETLKRAQDCFKRCLAPCVALLSTGTRLNEVMDEVDPICDLLGIDKCEWAGTLWAVKSRNAQVGKACTS